MSYQDKKGAPLALIEAVETLSHIADLEIDRNIAIVHQHDLKIEDIPINFKSVHWLQQPTVGQTIEEVKKIFKSILQYLRGFYKKEYGYIYDPHALEGIKTIMVLVGEAAKKLDKYTALFHAAHTKSVTELKEYKKLQEFYLNRIARKIDEGTLGKWILALAQKIKEPPAKKVTLIGRKSSQTKHIFIDLESVKKDTEYELFFLKKEDGSRFFSPRLIRNIKLVSDFGEYFNADKEMGPLIDTDLWQDRLAHHAAKSILHSVQQLINRFYENISGYKDMEFVEMINKALMALMLAANAQNLSHEFSVKCCKDYFYDFQQYLRKTLITRDYQRLMAYPPGESSKLAHSLIEIVQTLCQSLYIQIDDFHDLVPIVYSVLQEAKNEQSSTDSSTSKKQLWVSLIDDNKLLTKFLKRHPNGPMNRILNCLEDGECWEFDPLIQGNYPQRLFNIYDQKNSSLFIRLPSPTRQEFIHKVSIVNEFKEFLRSLDSLKTGKPCLIFNFQDRLTWKEHFRCSAIEELANSATFQKKLELATIAKDTEFYHQAAPYHTEEEANHFMKLLKQQVFEPNCGFLFSELLLKEMNVDFITNIINGIHKVFFKNRSRLTREERMNFISLFYLFIELKAYETIKPQIVAFTCKDSIDIGSPAAVEFFVFIKSFTQERLSENDQEHIDAMIYGPALLFRERLLLTERFQRMVNLIKCIETTAQEYTHKTYAKILKEVFGRYFKSSIFNAKVFFSSI